MRLVVADCSVDYVGRLSAHLPMATRLILTKADGSVSVHADDRAYKPLNWMSPPCAVREDVDAAHRAASAVKLERLQEQRRDLGGCLDALLADALAGRAYFKVYRQFKMYNDPRFNPALVAEGSGGTR